MGIKSDMIVREISSRIGQDFNVKLYGCQSLLEFLSKFIIPTMEIEIIYYGDSDREHYSIRSKQFFYQEM